jgi:hypothetical protein
MRLSKRAVLVFLTGLGTAFELHGQVVALTSPVVSTSAAAPAANVDTLLLEIRLQGFGGKLAKAITVNGVLQVPASAVAELSGMATEPADRFLALPALRAWLGTEVDYDAADLVVTITPVASMPAVARAARIRERAHLSTARETTDGSLMSPRAASVLAVDYDVFGSASGSSSYLIRAGVGVLGGEVSSLFTSGAEPEIAWTLHRPGAPLVSRLQLGTSHAASPRPRLVHGISIGNAPFYRPAVVDVRTLGGLLPAGWTVDAYRGGRLYAFDSVGTDGRFAVPLSLSYGENTVDLVAYGPRGERVALQEFLRFTPGMLARGQSEYTITLGRCADSDCRLAGNAHLRAGVSRALTVAGGVHYEQSPTGQRIIAPFGSIVASPGRGVSAEAEAYRDVLTRVTARFEPSASSGLEASWFNVPPVTGLPLLTGARSLRIDAWTSISTRPGLATVRAQFRHQPDPVAPRNELTLGSSHALGGIQFRPFTTTTVGRQPFAGASGLEVLASPSAGVASWLQGTWLRTLAEVDHAEGRFRRMEATLSRQVSRGLRVEGEGQWSTVMGKTIAVRMVTHTPQIRAIARSSRREHAPHGSWEYSAGGSAIVDAGERRVVMSSEPSTNRGGMDITAFLDVNADGVRQEDELPVARALIIVGSQSLKTDDAGRVYVWGVPAHEPVSVRVDSASVPPHWHVPPPLQLVLRNARTSRIELPIVPGSTLEGRMQLDGTDPATISLWLVDTRNQQQQEVALFRDGSFYVMSVRPGSYSLVARTVGTVQTALQQVRVVVPAADSPQQLAELTLVLSGAAKSVLRPPPR